MEDPVLTAFRDVLGLKRVCWNSGWPLWDRGTIDFKRWHPLALIENVKIGVFRGGSAESANA